MAKRLKNNTIFHAVTLPIAALLIALPVAGTSIANYFAPSLDNYLGRGEIKYDKGSAQYNEEDVKYYDQPFEKGKDGKYNASVAGYQLTEAIANEGITLLKNKNNALPLTKNAKVSPLGYRYIDPIMTGKGSGAATLLQPFVVNARDGLKHYLDVNPTMDSVLANASVRYATENGYKNKADGSGQFSGATTSVAEFPSNIYKASDIGEYKTAIVFIGRQGGEGDDLQMTPYYSDTLGGTKIANHQLELMPDEKEMVAFAKANFDKVVIILNTPNPMEIKELADDDGIDAIILCPTTGSRGFESLGKILSGEVNPSGRMVDTYYADFEKDPTYKNFGVFKYTNGGQQFTEYEENIYVGYKYYETRFANNETEYQNNVVYPLGYGLHYDHDNVSQTLDDVSYDETNKLVKVTGKVVNNSTYVVSETVQIYYEAPYYGSLGQSNIEKATKNLVNFEKITVKKNETSNFEITFALEDMASYDYKGFYTSGKGSYVLEKGDYNIYLGKNSHDSWGHKSINLEKTIVYHNEGNDTTAEYVGKRDSDEVLATNQYDNMNQYMNGEGEWGNKGTTDQISRSDNFVKEATSPTSKEAAQIILDALKDSDQGSDYSAKILAKYGNEAPKSAQKNGLILSELRGLDYDDPMWDKLLDQLVFEGDDLTELAKLFGQGSFNTAKISAIGKPTTSEADGPQAIGKTGVSDGTGAANAYTGEVVLAATWNKSLAESMGVSIANEALAQGSNGWYAPACNIHRSPFQGRTYEYYSEDPVLSGFMAQYTVQGASSQGYTPYLKHFAVNEQENGRSGLATWVNEQALREIYLKPFEMAVKNGEITEKYLAKIENTDANGNVTYTYESTEKKRKAAIAMMASLNRIGASFTCTDYSLMTTLLRDEWGFEGAVISDSYTPINNQLISGLSAGCDFFLSFMKGRISDSTSPAARWAMRQAVHHICYAVVNSNAMQNVGPSMTYSYGMSPWVWIVIAFDAVTGLGAAALITFNVLRFIDKKKNPDKYVSKNNK